MKTETQNTMKFLCAVVRLAGTRRPNNPFKPELLHTACKKRRQSKVECVVS